MYLASKFLAYGIEEVCAIKLNSSAVELESGDIVPIENDFDKYHETFAEAKKWLLEGAETAVKKREHKLSESRERLEKVKLFEIRDT